MPPGDSTMTFLKRETPLNPLKSRSTILCLACLMALISIVYLTIRSGYYTEAFAVMCLSVLKDVIVGCLTHQKTDPLPNVKPIPTSIPGAGGQNG